MSDCLKIIDSVKVWTPIIPNSQLIIFPFSLKQSKWEISIFIQPNEALLVVVIVTLGILAILAVIIGWHHYKEEQDDIQTQAQFFKLFR
ncbi:hypothetical protein IMG5_169990 [Ichthyophthirius multifiliis]|uniref:Uncharacterized protein n=1 Tax=Ichthyophthirius multifiliis TaxID=5932 RepID=G0R1E2_ICHMU|nr:hypothetical protein IMG5_169990 [Ichthyophthirius multifiliis]EGR28699.1 hypothetical protein IMG5_169990 [Ichthyophthirius multifiliis]|eukprot:XP_004029935.1 hypothetical protein IMG5_169990 [Ichthyophthirius multifiliis]